MLVSWCVRWLSARSLVVLVIVCSVAVVVLVIVCSVAVSRITGCSCTALFFLVLGVS